jgi:sugar phosphate isomerase/epimerase
MCFMAVKLAISSYSFHRFGGGPEGKEPLTIEQMIDQCVAYNVSGLEILTEHLKINDKTSPGALHELRQYAAIRGIVPVTIAASHNPVQVTEEARAVELDKLKQTVDWASAIGAPFVRALGGRWNTAANFQALLDNDGEEPPIEGYTMDQGYEWAIEALKEGAAYAGSKGITLVLENHWGLTGTEIGCLRIQQGVGSPWLKLVLDTGNFVHRPDQYAAMATFLPALAVCHAKVYKGGGMVVTPEIDYTRVADLLASVNYNGYLSVEFEGKAHPSEGIPEGLATIRSAFNL